MALAFIWLFFIQLVGTSRVIFFCNSSELGGQGGQGSGRNMPGEKGSASPSAQVNWAARHWTSENLANFPHQLAQKVWQSHKTTFTLLLIKVKRKSVTAEMPQVTVPYKPGTGKDFCLAGQPELLLGILVPEGSWFQRQRQCLPPWAHCLPRHLDRASLGWNCSHQVTARLTGKNRCLEITRHHILLSVPRESQHLSLSPLQRMLYSNYTSLY